VNGQSSEVQCKVEWLKAKVEGWMRQLAVGERGSGGDTWIIFGGGRKKPPLN